MAIEFRDDLHCDLCGEKVTGGWGLHEVAPNRWAVVCDPCERTTEIGEGK